ncbi:MAG: hypothetical protein IJ087_12985 [Eggerthellaceae bacterium]|nr:hypothetical protein [Eggerthellaceae bacterium]
MKRLGFVLSAIALCSLSLGPGFALADDGAALPSEKEEAVHVYANPDGSVRDGKVEVTLRNANGLPILTDTSSLSDVKPSDESQSFTGDGQELTWTAKGEDVSYTGKSDKSIPVSVAVSYTLDGVAVSPSDISGKTGKVRIRYDFRNDSAFTSGGHDMRTPFTAITALMLDGKAFKNVRVTNGKIVNDGDNVIVVGYAMPGLKESLGSAAEDADVPEYFEVEADVEGFELKSTLTMVSAGLMEDMDLEPARKDDLSSTSAGLTEATAALVESSDGLAEGLGALADGTEGVSGAAWQLNAGAQAASESLPALVESIEELDKGAAALAEGAAKLKEGTAPLSESVEQAQKACQLALTVLATMESSIETVKSNNEAAQAIVAGVMGSSEVPESARAELAQAVAALQANDLYLSAVSSPGSAEPALQQLMAAVQQLNENLDPDSAAALSDGAAKLSAGADALAEGLDALSDGTAPLVKGVRQLVYGTGELASGADELANGAKEAAAGSNELAKGMHEYSEQAIAEIVDVIDNKVVDLVDRLDALKQAARDYDNFSGKPSGVSSTVRFVIEVDAV